MHFEDDQALERAKAAWCQFPRTWVSNRVKRQSMRKERVKSITPSGKHVLVVPSESFLTNSSRAMQEAMEFYLLSFKTTDLDPLFLKATWD